MGRGRGRGSKRSGGRGRGELFSGARRNDGGAARSEPIKYLVAPWAAEDDSKLAALVAAEGLDEWHDKAKALGGRNPNEVWTRWFRCVDPDRSEAAPPPECADAEGKERPLKRPKLATDGADTSDSTKTVGRFSKKKVAVMFGFLGANYQGFQRNPGAKTLEDAIERALYAAGGIMPSNYGDLKKIAWTRSARTDKGVSAAACCVGMRLVMVREDFEQMVKRINLHMPPEIRVHSITPVVGGFDAKAQCSKRRYEYLLPTYALQRRGAREQQLSDPSRTVDPDVPLVRTTQSHHSESPLNRELQSLRAVLAKFEGTHNFHNYTTSQVKATDAQAKRYILSFEASDPFVLDGLELVRCTVLGQSFMMHQVSNTPQISITLHHARSALSRALNWTSTRDLRESLAGLDQRDQ